MTANASAGLITLAVIAAVSSAGAQVQLTAVPNLIDLSHVQDSALPPISTVTIGAVSSSGATTTKYRYTGVTIANTAVPMPPNFLIVTPTSGTTPGAIFVALNESVVGAMERGAYSLYLNFSTVDQSPAAATQVLVSLGLARTPPSITSVLNSASFQPAVSPGALVSIFGTNFGPPVTATQYDGDGAYPTGVPDNASTNTTVTFGGIAAPLTYVSGSQINAIVPFGVSGMKTVDVVVTCYNLSSAAFSVPILDTSPAIFTATQNGTGQGAILNVNPQDPYAPGATTYNSPSNPAPPGFAIVMYATGAGAWNPPIPDGEIALTILNPMCSDIDLECTKLVNQPLTVTIGGKPATVFYAGTALYEPWSLLQINAYVPNDAPSGQQPVVLKIGQNDNSQQGVTIAIQ